MLILLTETWIGIAFTPAFVQHIVCRVLSVFWVVWVASFFFLFVSPPAASRRCSNVSLSSVVFVRICFPPLSFFDLQIPKSVRLAEELQGKQASDESHHQSLPHWFREPMSRIAKQSIGEPRDFFSTPYWHKKRKKISCYWFEICWNSNGF